MSDPVALAQVPVTLIDDASTVWELVVRRAAIDPDLVLLTDEHDRSLTMTELVDYAERTAAGLYALGIGAGSRVSWQLPTRIDSIVLCLALARLGAIQNPIIPIYRSREVASLLRQTEADVLVTPRAFRGFDHEAMAQQLATTSGRALQLIIADDPLPTADRAGLPPPPDHGDEVRWIYTTSGTTSEPKGVLHTDATLLAGGRGWRDASGINRNDVTAMAYPFAHIGGPDMLVAILSTGTPCVLMEMFTPDAATVLFNKYGVTVSGGSTAFYSAFLAKQRTQPGVALIPALRLLSGGGAPKPAVLYWQVKEEMGVRTAHGYGMTECPMITNGQPDDTDEQLAETEGRPVTGAEVQVRDEDGAVLPPGTEGAVWVRGPMLFHGYIGLTDEQSGFASASDGGGRWFSTGDIGVLRESGHLTLVGRSKDVIIRKGENISPREIEDVLATHPAVGGVAVIGLPDTDRGEIVCAVLELQTGAEQPTLEDVRAHCTAAGLAVHKSPEQIEVVEALPRTATMKILKRELKTQFTSQIPTHNVR